MLTSRWLPYAVNELNRLHEQMDQIFAPLVNARAWPGLGVSYPALNTWEDGDNLYVEAELPGVDQDKLEIFVSGGNQLTIKGQRTLAEVPQGMWHRQERGIGMFHRSMTLPVVVNADAVEARFERGVLLITLPKHETAKPRQITVKAE